MADPIDCAVCTLRACRLFTPMSAEELAFMRDFKTGERQIAPSAEIVAQGERSASLYTVLSGMGTRSILLEDGRRQVVNFVFPGDLIGLQAGLMGEAPHSVTASMPMVLCVFPRDRIWSLFAAQPARAYDLTWIAAVGEHFLGETVATLGQRDATERMAWALTRIWRRLLAVGMQDAQGRVPFPFRQHDLADALGLSVVHVNRILGQLRRAGLVDLPRRQLVVLDLPRLAALAGMSLEAEEVRPIL